MDLNKVYESVLEERKELKARLSEIDGFIATVERMTNKNSKGKQVSIPEPATEGLRTIRMTEAINLVAEILKEVGKVENGTDFVDLFAKRGYHVTVRTLSSYMSQPAAKKLFTYNREKGGWGLVQSNEVQQNYMALREGATLGTT